MRHRRRRALPALMLALALAALAAPATAQAPPIDLREYWIIADIDNTKTGESESFRIDCSKQQPYGCGVSDKRWSLSMLGLRRGALYKDSTGTEVLVRLLSISAPPYAPHYVGLIVAGARGHIASFPYPLLETVEPVAVLFTDVRSAQGWSAKMTWHTDNMHLSPEKSGITFRLRLMTPQEIEDEAAAAADVTTQRALLVAERERLAGRLAEIDDELDRLDQSKAGE